MNVFQGTLRRDKGWRLFGKRGETYMDVAVKMITSVVLGGVLLWGYTVYFSSGFLAAPVKQLMNVYAYSSAKPTYQETTVDPTLIATGTVPGDANPTPAVFQKVKNPEVSTAPLNPAAAQTGNDIAVSWSPPMDDGGAQITGYCVYCDGVKLAQLDGNTLDCTITGKATGSHKIRITALNSAGESAPALLNFNLSATAPSEPQNVKASMTNGTATITWEAPATDGGSQITGYNVYQDDKLLSSTSLLSLQIPGLSAGDHLFQVTAVNEAGESHAAWVWITITTVPGPPSAITASSDKNTVSVSWAAPKSDGGSAVLGYNVYLNGVKQNTGALISGTSYQIGDLIGTGYTVSVTAVNAIGESTPAKYAYALYVVSAPGIPSNVNVNVDAMAQKATVTWGTSKQDGNGAILGYNVYYDGKKMNSSPIELSSSGEGSYIISNVSYNNPTKTDDQHVVRVVAVNAVGEGTPREIGFTCYDPRIHVTGVSASPSSLTLNAGESSYLATTVTPSNATDSTVTWSSSNPAVATVDSSGKVFAVKPGQVTITAKTNDGDFTANCIVTISNTPSIPQKLTASMAGDTTVKISWDTPENDGHSPITGYKVSVNGTDYTTTSTNYSVTCPANTTFSITVSGENANGFGSILSKSYTSTSHTRYWTSKDPVQSWEIVGSHQEIDFTKPGVLCYDSPASPEGYYGFGTKTVYDYGWVTKWVETDHSATYYTISEVTD